jgi:hypothetical protein
MKLRTALRRAQFSVSLLQLQPGRDWFKSFGHKHVGKP